jgi:hypothetical protein
MTFRVLRGLVADIASVSEATAEVGVARALSAAAESASWISADLAVEGGEEPPEPPGPPNGHREPLRSWRLSTPGPNGIRQ